MKNRAVRTALPLCLAGQLPACVRVWSGIERGRTGAGRVVASGEFFERGAHRRRVYRDELSHLPGLRRSIQPDAVDAIYGDHSVIEVVHWRVQGKTKTGASDRPCPGLWLLLQKGRLFSKG